MGSCRPVDRRPDARMSMAFNLKTVAEFVRKADQEELLYPMGASGANRDWSRTQVGTLPSPNPL